MRKEIIAFACVLGIVGASATAFAGAYGEPEKAEELPSPPPAPPAVAEQAEDYAALGPYLGIGGVYAIEMFDGGVDAGNSNGFNVRAGYRVHPNVAVEALYEWYKEWDTDPAGHVNGWSLSANAKAYPITGRWQPYALAGLGYLSLDASPGGSDGGFMMRFGGGLDANITENWQIGPEIAYVLPFGDVDDADFLAISGGVRYRF